MLSTIIEMGRAWFRAGASALSNETFLDAKPNTYDPVKHRMGTFDRGNYYGAFSGDLLAGDFAEPVRYEKVLIGLKPDDDPESIHAMEPGGSFEVRCQQPNSREDATMSPPGLRVTSRHVELFGRKVATRQNDGNVTFMFGGGGSVGDSLTSSDGRYKLVMQGDGNLVIYRQDGSVVWATYTQETQ